MALAIMESGARGAVNPAGSAASVDSGAAAERPEVYDAAGAVMGRIAHDLNNLLTPVQGFMALLETEVPARGDAAEFLDEMRQGLSRIGAWTTRLLDAGRRSRMECRPLDLVRRAEAEVKRFSEVPEFAGLRLEVGTTGGAVIANANGGHLRRALVEILRNAVTAMGGAGRARLVVDRALWAGGAVGLDAMPPGEYAVLSVEDEGPGVSESLRLRVFEPFFTTRPPPVPRGSGLGLCVARGLVRDQGGSLAVGAAPVGGARVSVYLPAGGTGP